MEVIDQNITFIGFLITAVVGLSFFVKYLVGKILSVVKENTEAFMDLKGAITDLKTTIQLKQ